MSTTLTPLIRGSLAIDTILLHRGAFATRILPSEIARLNVSFGIEQARDEFGGTGGNIAYGAFLLGDSPIINASLGGLDSAAWIERIASWGFSTDALRVVDGALGPHAYIITDSSDNQISAFQSGALSHVAPLPVSGFDFAHLAPDSAESMAYAAQELLCRGIPYILDPGQALPSLLEGQSGANFLAMLHAASGLFVNDYEAELCALTMKTPFEKIAERLPFCVRTLGSKGCELWIHGAGPTLIPVANANTITDPTGCGDAFRSGFLHGYCRAWGPQHCAQLGSVMGSFAIERSGGQNHAPSLLHIQHRYEENYGAFPSFKPSVARP